MADKHAVPPEVAFCFAKLREDQTAEAIQELHAIEYSQQMSSEYVILNNPEEAASADAAADVPPSEIESASEKQRVAYDRVKSKTHTVVDQVDGLHDYVIASRFAMTDSQSMLQRDKVTQELCQEIDTSARKAVEKATENERQASEKLDAARKANDSASNIQKLESELTIAKDAAAAASQDLENATRRTKGMAADLKKENEYVQHDRYVQALLNQARVLAMESQVSVKHEKTMEAVQAEFDDLNRIINEAVEDPVQKMQEDLRLLEREAAELEQHVIADQSKIKDEQALTTEDTAEQQGHWNLKQYIYSYTWQGTEDEESASCKQESRKPMSKEMEEIMNRSWKLKDHRSKIVTLRASLQVAERTRCEVRSQLSTIQRVIVEQPKLEEMMNPKWNRQYGPGKTNWDGNLSDGRNRGDGEIYECPAGWTRYGVRVKNFDDEWTGSAVAYHGSAVLNATSILETGVRGTQGCYCDGNSVGYFSPSIAYCSHPRYAKVWHNTTDGKFYQMVFQCRIKPAKIWKRERITIGKKPGASISSNLDEGKMEWLVRATDEREGRLYVPRDEVVLYGVMIRKTDNDPAKSADKWW